MIKRSIVLISCLILTPFMYSQNNAWNEKSFDKYEDLTALSIDHLGFVWLGVAGGIVKYNGYEELFYGFEEKSKVRRIEFIQNDIYIGNESGEVYKMSAIYKNQPQKIFSASTSPISSIVQLENSLFFFSYGDGLYIKNDEDENHYTEKKGLISDYIYSAKVLHDGRLVLATDRGIQVIGFENNKLSFIKKIEIEGSLATNIEAKDSLLFISNLDSDIIKYDLNLNVKEIISLPKKVEIYDIKCINKHLYIATEDGLWMYDDLNNLSKVKDGKCIALAHDLENNIWTIQAKNRLLYKTMYFELANIQTSEKIQSFFIDNNLTILGTKDGILWFENGKPVVTKFKGTNVTTIKKIDQNFWIGTFTEGIIILDTKGSISYKFNVKNGLGDNNVITLEDTKKGVFVSTLSGVKNIKYNAEKPKLSIVSDEEKVFGYNYILSIYPSKFTDSIYFGTDRNGYFVLSKSGISHHQKIKKDTTEEKIGSVYSFCEDNEGKLWFTSTNFGLCSIENSKPLAFGKLRNKEDEYTSIIKSNDGNLLGIRTKTVDLIGPERKHIMYFDKEIKIHGEQPILNAVQVYGSKIFFLHDNALYTFTPAIESAKIHPDVILDQVEVNFAEVPIEKLEFNQNENNFKFYYTGCWMSDPNKITYSYMLEGQDEGWNYTKERTARYSNLEPGKYTFKVRATENGVWDDEPETTYTFRVERSLYNTWIFKILMIAIPIFLAFWYYRNKRNQENLKTELSKLMIETQFINLKSQLNPHFLFNSFNTLIGLIELDPKKGITFTEKLTDFYRTILDSGKSDLIELSKEAHLAQLYSDLLKERYMDNISIEISQQLPGDVWIPPLTLQMLIENAVKHNTISSQKHLQISVNIEGEEIIVSNNINPKLNKERDSGIGQKNIVERYKMFTDIPIKIKEIEGFYKVYLPFITDNNKTKNK